VNGDLRRANLDLDRHELLPLFVLHLDSHQTEFETRARFDFYRKPHWALRHVGIAASAHQEIDKALFGVT
jgi:hypothetical protein